MCYIPVKGRSIPFRARHSSLADRGILSMTDSFLVILDVFKVTNLNPIEKQARFVKLFADVVALIRVELQDLDLVWFSISITRMDY